MMTPTVQDNQDNSNNNTGEHVPEWSQWGDQLHKTRGSAGDQLVLSFKFTFYIVLVSYIYHMS